MLPRYEPLVVPRDPTQARSNVHLSQVPDLWLQAYVLVQCASDMVMLDLQRVEESLRFWEARVKGGTHHGLFFLLQRGPLQFFTGLLRPLVHLFRRRQGLAEQGRPAFKAHDLLQRRIDVLRRIQVHLLQVGCPAPQDRSPRPTCLIPFECTQTLYMVHAKASLLRLPGPEVQQRWRTAAVAVSDLVRARRTLAAQQQQGRQLRLEDFRFPAQQGQQVTPGTAVHPRCEPLTDAPLPSQEETRPVRSLADAAQLLVRSRHLAATCVRDAAECCDVVAGAVELLQRNSRRILGASEHPTVCTRDPRLSPFLPLGRSLEAKGARAGYGGGSRGRDGARGIHRGGLLPFPWVHPQETDPRQPRRHPGQGSSSSGGAGRLPAPAGLLGPVAQGARRLLLVPAGPIRCLGPTGGTGAFGGDSLLLRAGPWAQLLPLGEMRSATRALIARELPHSLAAVLPGIASVGSNPPARMGPGPQRL